MGFQSLVNFGDPFLFRIEENETLSQIKERIRGKLPKEVTDEDYAKYKFYIVHPLRAPQPLSDTDVVASHMPKTAFASVRHFALPFISMLSILLALSYQSSILSCHVLIAVTTSMMLSISEACCLGCMPSLLL